jgi:single-strand DNA-binding protein
MLNRVILIGRLVADPELKYTPSGIAVAQFRIAVDRPLSNEARQAGQEKSADFIDIVAWRQSAEFASQYLTKGRLVAVEGKLQIREYQTQDGQRRKAAEVVADNLKGLDRPRETEGGGEYSGGGGGGYERAERPAAPARSSGGYGGARASAPAAGGDYDDMGDLADPFAE